MTTPKIPIAITQRATFIEERSEWSDSLDQSWVPFLNNCGFDVFPMPNLTVDPKSFMEAVGAKAVILSGGGDIGSNWRTHTGRLPTGWPNAGTHPNPRDSLESRLLDLSFEKAWPVIGVCRGMQFINLYYNGFLSNTNCHVRVVHKLESQETNHRFRFEKEVNSFHDLAVPSDGIGENLKTLAMAGDTVEAFIHKFFPHLGIMWHPERRSPYSEKDIEIFKNFLGTSKVL